LIVFEEFKKIYISLTILIAVGFSGVFGYMWLEGFSFSEALYMTVITISTVGFKEVHPMSQEGMYFTIFLIIFSFGIFAYNIQLITSFILDGNLRRRYKKIKQLNQIKKMKEHIVICGYGRNGHQIVDELKEAGQKFIIIERNKKLFENEEKSGRGNIFLQGDATDDQLLIDAGIKKAKALITTLPEDTDNLFVVLTAREMNPELLIISRASKDSTDKKLRMAGANNVVMPDKVGGAHMASLVIKPDVVEFFNHLTGQDSNVAIVEVCYEDLPEEKRNQSIRDLGIAEKSGSNIIGFKDAEGKYYFNPLEETKIESGTKLFVLGSKEQIEKLKKWN